MSRVRRGRDEPTIIKKYANRRLYDTGRSSYVTLDDLCEMVKEGHDFVVQDAKTGEDISQSVLTQIIVEQESRGGQSLLPTSFLRKLISFYGGDAQSAVPNYLEQTMDFFTKNQEVFQEQINKSLKGMNMGVNMFPGGTSLEEMNRKNMEMFERTMKMFTPFGGAYPGSVDAAKSDKEKALKDKIAALEEELKKMGS
ncbi:MAG TPA: polyhydroxyalkanoate synthesis repressor PhaR [Alphaproteobacteria bacterium]|nr:polyhydroxyalkanoate synthesis repressor PhaR [Alphaproteobacteria bacterium]